MQQAPHGTGPAQKAHIVLQPTFEEEPEEKVTGEVVATEEVVVVGKPAAEVVVDEDATMQDTCGCAGGQSGTISRSNEDDAKGCHKGIAGNPVRQDNTWVPRAEPGGNHLAKLPGDAQIV